MNEAGALLAAILAQPAEQTPWLVLCDWLAEQGDADSLARLELLRLRTQWVNATGATRKKVERQFLAALKGQPALRAPLAPLLEHQFPILAAPVPIALFLLADYAPVELNPIAADSTWTGKLIQAPYQFPTTLVVRARTGNRFEGDMRENFRSMYHANVTGTFHFRGAVAGPHVAFVTYRTQGAAAGPGLYQFRIDEQHRWEGTWAVRAGNWSGTMWLQPKPAKAPRASGKRARRPKAE